MASNKNGNKDMMVVYIKVAWKYRMFKRLLAKQKNPHSSQFVAWYQPKTQKTFHFLCPQFQNHHEGILIFVRAYLATWNLRWNKNIIRLYQAFYSIDNIIGYSLFGLTDKDF